MKFVRVAGEEVNYRVYGEGRPLVLLHGFGGSHADWDRVARQLSQEGFEIIIPNFTSLYLNPERPITFSQQAHIVRNFIEIMADEKGKVLVAGASYGGALGWAVSLLAPELIEKLVLVNPMPPRPRKNVKDKVLKAFLLFGRSPEALGAFMLSPVGRLALPHIERLFRFPYAGSEVGKRKRRIAHMTRRKLKVIVHVVHRFLWICRNENWIFWERQMSSMAVPVQVIWGDRDKLFDRRVYLNFKTYFRDCELCHVEGGQHMLIRNKPDKVAQLISHYLMSDKRGPISA